MLEDAQITHVFNSDLFLSYTVLKVLMFVCHHHVFKVADL